MVSKIASDDEENTMELEAKTSRASIKRIVDFREDIFNRITDTRNSHLWLHASLKDVKKILLIQSASRSGSSLLFSILRRLPQIYSLSGESVPFYKMHGFSPDIYPSETVPKGELDGIAANFNLMRDFLSDFRLQGDGHEILNDPYILKQYIDDLLLRFSMQWPEIKFSYPVFEDLAQQAFIFYARRYQKFRKENFYLELFRFLRAAYPDINPYYYDIPADMIREAFPDLPVPAEPPNDSLAVEEPPFILLSPDKRVTRKDLSDKILLLKSTVDCYKMNLIETLFPNAEMKIIYLIRNPAASINGLYDGWLYRGFFSHNLKDYFKGNSATLNRLKISGYSDQFEWAKWWWKFDLPPGWQNFATKPLEKVCALQWQTANQAILKYINNRLRSYCLVKYENIAIDLKTRVREIKKIIDFINIDSDAIEMLKLEDLPVVQSTCSPQPYRWRKKKNLIEPLLSDPGILEMCESIGYQRDRIEEWI